MKYLKTTDIATVENYPYGRLKAKATFSLEFKKGYGFRMIFQTVNPKTGRINNPKKGGYVPAMVLTDTDGFISTKHLRFNGAEEIVKDCAFMAEHFDLFTPEQIEDIYALVFNMLKVDTIARVQYSGADLERIKPFMEGAIKAAVRGFKEKGIVNTFGDIKIDLESLEKLSDPNFNPFRTTVGPISILEMAKQK